MAWFNNLMEKDEFRSVAQIITEGKGPDSLKVIIFYREEIFLMKEVNVLAEAASYPCNSKLIYSFST